MITLSGQYELVPDSHQDTNWFKVVIMEHVTVDKLALLINEIKKYGLLVEQTAL